MNGDGLGDVALGTIIPTGSSLPGYVRAYSGLTGALLWQRNGSYAAHRLGYALAAAGDVNADGVPDVVAGAIGDHTFGTANGAAFVYDGATGATLRTWIGAAGGHRLGYSLGGVGDVNGDGASEVVVGTFRNNGPGYARVYDGASGAILYAMQDAVVADHFGHSVCAAGDWNGDGVPDFVVSGTDADINGVNDAGFVRVYSGATGAQLRQFNGRRVGRHLAFGLAAAGDVNGDGLADLMMGAISDGSSIRDACTSSAMSRSRPTARRAEATCSRSAGPRAR